MNTNSTPTPASSDGRRRCDLCDVASAAVHCSSDEAMLCWSCDAKVHNANFLVSRHSRSLLCHRCAKPTTWTAAGARLPSLTFSLCDRCYRQGEDGRPAGATVEEDGSEEEYDDDDGDDSCDDEGDNQVVPWSPATSSVPPVTSSSSSDEEDEFSCRLNLKRNREIRDFKFEDGGISSSSSESENSENVRSSSGDDRPFKRVMIE